MDLLREPGFPVHLRLDIVSEFMIKGVRERLRRVAVKSLFSELGSPWENGNVESFNMKTRCEFLDCEMFYYGKEPQVFIEQC